MSVVDFGDDDLNSLSATVPSNDGHYDCSCPLVFHCQQVSLGGRWVQKWEDGNNNMTTIGLCLLWLALCGVAVEALLNSKASRWSFG